MDTNNTNADRRRPETGMPAAGNRSVTRTEQPHWQGTITELDFTPLPLARGEHSQCSLRKLYMLLGGWAFVLTVLLALSPLRQDVLPARSEHQRQALPTAFDTVPHPDEEPMRLSLPAMPQSSVPTSFRHRTSNVITRAQLLQPLVPILVAGDRPLRVLHVGDSHVRGNAFPQAVSRVLHTYLGKADSQTEGNGVYFSYIARNGATNRHFLTADYLQSFASRHPDLIILSLGTNEAHGMGYLERVHEAQLNEFLDALQAACPDAVVLLTTPPGDFLPTRYVDYHVTARQHKRTGRVRTVLRPNPMSARCATLIEQVGEQRGLPVWNLFEICGGAEAAQRNWEAAHYMRPDRVHFTPAGYDVQGRMLAEALLVALTD